MLFTQFGHWDSMKIDYCGMFGPTSWSTLSIFHTMITGRCRDSQVGTQLPVWFSYSWFCLKIHAIVVNLWHLKCSTYLSSTAATRPVQGTHRVLSWPGQMRRVLPWYLFSWYSSLANRLEQRTPSISKTFQNQSRAQLYMHTFKSKCWCSPSQRASCPVLY